MTVLASKVSRAAAGQSGRRSGLRRVADGVVVLALVIVAVALASAVAPRLVGFEGLAITSGSMGKAAPVGSLVLVRDKLPSEIRAGDVIALERPGSPIVVHRVLAVETVDGKLVVATKGDANPTPDPESYPLPAQVPVMARSIPLVGYLVALLKIPLGWILLIALPATAVAAAVIRDLWRADEDELGSLSTVVTGDLQPALDATRAELAALRDRAGRALLNMKQQLDEARTEAARLRSVVATAEAGVGAVVLGDPRATELEGLLETARGDAASLRDRLDAAEAKLHDRAAPDRRLVEVQRLLDEARGEIGSLRKALAAAAVTAERAAAPSPRIGVLEHELAQAEMELVALRQAVVEARAAAAAPDPRVAELETVIVALRAESVAARDRLEAADARLIEALAPDPKLAELERLLAEVRGDTAALREAQTATADAVSRADAAERKAQELEERLADEGDERAALVTRIAALESEQAAAPVATSGPHLLYVSTTSGYRLVSTDGELPAPGARIELDGRSLVVARVGASPLPGDRRRCAFVSPV